MAAEAESGQFMTLEEMNAEVVECARYGEHEDLKALLDAGADVNAKDDGGSTALHKACANGEMECLALLFERKALYLPNDGGNLPLHWACQNGQLQALQFLIDNYKDEIDVLVKNSLGRSSLTEAFQKGDEKVLEVVLSHPSSSEENLMRTTPGITKDSVKIDIEEEEEGDGEGETVFASADKALSDDAFASGSVTHTMALDPTNPEQLLLVRELPITRADNPFGTETAPEDDTTGLGLWPATVICARWACTPANSALMKGKVVAELGAGCGLPGLAVAVYTEAKSVYITDIHEPTLRNAVHNVQINGQNQDQGEGSEGEKEKTKAILGSSLIGDTTTAVSNVSWTEENTYPSEPVDVVLGSDLVYDAALPALLGMAVEGMLVEGGSFLYVAPDNSEGIRDGMAGLVEALALYGLVLMEKKPCSEDLYANPLAKGSVVYGSEVAQEGQKGESQEMEIQEEEEKETSDDFVLHFYDLARKQPHTLFTFVKKSETKAAAAVAAIERTRQQEQEMTQTQMQTEA